ncbi:RNA-directed DNA polymerase [Desulfobacter latus]|uniref:RNA-directed DNA polymerase n=1 Tax=Desulfobacter latus TaxID=2292 RepID=A0A850T656_9BACT|nr:RNA-directed DNA polymerase [Desulfobacter latus]NWH04812.1 RNA-directed DNA polymerase [Desulfobacter latus]
MKRTGNLIVKIADPDNLRLAFSRACLGKQQRREVIRFRENLQYNLLQLRDEVLSETINLGEYRFFYVYEPKKRHICAPPFRDRVLHHAIMNLVEPVFERYAIFDHWIKEKKRIKGYLRYMDDFLIFGHDRETLRAVRDDVQDFLAEKLHLKLHQNRLLAQCRTGIPFLGYRVFPDGLRLLGKSKNRFSRKLKKYEQLYHEGLWDIDTLTRHVTSLVSFTEHADSAGFRRRVLCNMRSSSC